MCPTVVPTARRWGAARRLSWYSVIGAIAAMTSFLVVCPAVVDVLQTHVLYHGVVPPVLEVLRCRITAGDYFQLPRSSFDYSPGDICRPRYSRRAMTEVTWVPLDRRTAAVI